MEELTKESLDEIWVIGRNEERLLALREQKFSVRWLVNNAGIARMAPSKASAFQPVPYINLYASTKAFERNYSRALHAELAPLGITVTAICPFTPSM